MKVNRHFKFDVLLITLVNITVCVLLYKVYSEHVDGMHFKNIHYMPKTFIKTTKPHLLSLNEESFSNDFKLEFIPISKNMFYCVYNDSLIKLFNTKTFFNNLFLTKDSKIEVRFLLTMAYELLNINISPITIKVVDNDVYYRGFKNSLMDADILRIVCHNKIYGNTYK